MKNPYAEIHFALPLGRGYAYGIPEPLDQLAVPGVRALVPFGKRVATGFIVRRVASIDFPSEKLKHILDVLDDAPLFDEARLALAKWVAEYYVAGFGEVLRTMLPPGLEAESKQFVKMTRRPNDEELMRIAARAPRQAEILRALLDKEGYKVAHLARNLGHTAVRSSLRSLMRQGFVEISQRFKQASTRPLTVTHVQLTDYGKEVLEHKKSEQNPRVEADADEALDVVSRSLRAARTFGRLSEKQWLGLELLHKHGLLSRAGLLRRSGMARSSLKTLVGRSLVKLISVEMERNPYAEVPVEATKFTLNAEQQHAVAQVAGAIEPNQFKVFLLHGVTGSGKTQVYIEAIRHALQKGKGAIVLVPEISLTPQAVARFKGNLGETIAVLHSRLSAGERHDAWKRLQRGDAKVVVGARSAVFAPVRNLGLIVVDEEHESSYKQVDPSPRYHARDVAIMRAKMSNAVALLGSATPAVESYYNAQTGKYQKLELPFRIDNVPLPRVRLVDMMRFRLTAPDRDSIFSRILFEKIQDRLARKEQVILLQNRRGFAPMVRCVNCGYTRFCDACNVAMIYHKIGHMLRCHYCNAYEKAPDACPQCQGIDLIFKGIGTQKVEAALRELLPEARVVRMDSDTTRGKLSHDRILRDFGEHRFDILLGTQMIAKGLDFHRVTLVGVISADLSLFRPDFRSGERTFQLLTQVAGRAGRRNLPGEVIIQSYAPEDFCLKCAQEHDFLKFYTAEIRQRQELSYAPFVRLALVQFRHKDLERVRATANEFTALLRSSKAPITVYGPTPSPLSRLRNEFRFQSLIKSHPNLDPGARQMRATLTRAFEFFRKVQPRARVRIQIDIDPVTML